MDTGSAPHWLEGIVAEAIEAYETGGDAGLEAVCARHPEHSERVRRVVTRFAGVAPRPATPFPERLGGFRLLRRLGAGGMGVVFEAEQVGLGRSVAVKVVRPELLYFEGARERFRREIEAVARLHHPAIVPVLASGDEGGVPFYAMELVEGMSLEELGRRLAERDPSRLTGADALREVCGAAAAAHELAAAPYWEACVRLLLPVCDGIAHAHARGIVHRDLKPSNVMITADGRATVVDFGLAHVADEQRMTQSGSQPGSPAYMAPEQLRGEATDRRVDVYALGATLHQALALAPPFPATDPEVLRRRVLEGAPTPLHERNRAVPRELVLVLQCAMDRDASRRYRTVPDLAADLNAVLHHLPIRARRLPLALRGFRFLQRHPTASVVAAALAVIAVLVPVALWWQQVSANAVLAAARDRAEGNYETALLAIDEMLLRAGSDRLRHLPASQQVGVELVEQALGYFARLAEANPGDGRVEPHRLRASAHLAAMQLALGRVEQAAATAEQAIADLGGADAALPVAGRIVRASLWRTLAGVRAVRNDREGLTHAAGRVVADLDGIDAGAAPDPIEVGAGRAFAHACLADAARMARDADGEEANLRRAVEFARDVSRRAAAAGGFRGDLLQHLCSLATCLRYRERWDEAEQALAEAEAELEGMPSGGADTWHEAMLRARVADEAAQIGFARERWGEAERAFRAGLGLRERIVADYPDLIEPRRLLGGTRNNLARLLIRRERFAEAADLLRLAVADQRWVLARDATEYESVRYLGNHLNALAHALRELDAWDELAEVADQRRALPGSPQHARRAADDLLRCAAAARPEARRPLLERAVECLLEAERRGWGRGDLADPAYDALLPVDGFAELRGRVAGR